MSEPDRLWSSDEGYDERPKGARTGEGGGQGEAAAMSLVSQEAQRGELCGGDDGGGAWGAGAEFNATAQGALAAQAGVGSVFMAEMSRRGQADELRAGWDGGAGGAAGDARTGALPDAALGAGAEAGGGAGDSGSGDTTAVDAACSAGAATDGAGLGRLEGATSDGGGFAPAAGDGVAATGLTLGPVGPGDAHPPPVDVPLLYRSDGKGVTVTLLTGETPSGWTVVEPGDRTWPLYYALFRARTDPGEVDYATLGPVVGALFGPQLAAGLPGAGEWRKPEGLPGDLYVGSEAHEAIGLHYKAQHGGRKDIYLNRVSVSGIAINLKENHGPQYQHLRPELGGPFKPDITDAGLKHLYEIKPAWSAAVGQLEAQAYMAALNRTGLAIKLGPPGVPGTRGKIAGPGGWFTFDVVMPGVIGYRFVRKEPVPYLLPLPERVPARRQQPSKKRLFEWRYWEEVTGLTGAALLVYLIISQGSRIIPIRNAIPIP